MMIGIKLEMLSLITTMHSAGLMPEDDYKIEKQRLVEELTRESNSVGPLNLEDWEEFRRSGNLGDEQLFNRIANAIETKPDHFEWRGVISDFLESAYYASDWVQSLNEEEILIEAERMGVQTASPFVSIGAISLFMKEVAHLRKEVSKIVKKLTKFESLSDEIESLKREIRALKSHESRALPEISDRYDDDRNAEVEDLQQRMARCLTFAAQYEAKGDSYAAGKHRGEAARIESKLRSLGA